MIRACIMGFPVSHSLSPKLHGHWLRQYNIAGEYTARETKPENLKDSLKELADKGYAGCNLTLPLKQYALELMDKLDDSARAAGAVNTVSIKGGRMTGYNSDGFGFVESLSAQCPDWNGATTVILGTGGAARGIIASLRGRGAGHFILVNRTPEKAAALARDLNLTAPRIVAWDDRSTALAQATLLVNCSSLGMIGHPPLDLDLTGLPKSATVCDIVYRPLETPLLTEARQRGNGTVEGLPMLLHQGRLGFKLWFGVDPAVTQDLYNNIATGVA